MKLTEETKNKISEILDSDEFMNSLYVDSEGNKLDKETRDQLGQFYTPGKICIQMIEKYDCDSLSGKNILDPTCGSGNLLIACLIAGADLDKLYGNEYDAKVIPTCRKRILRAAEILGLDISKFNSWQIHQGNALIADCLTEFGPEYDNAVLKELLKKRWGLKGGWIDNPEHYKEAEQGNLFEDFLGGN